MFSKNTDLAQKTNKQKSSTCSKFDALLTSSGCMWELQHFPASTCSSQRHKSTNPTYFQSNLFILQPIAFSVKCVESVYFDLAKQGGDAFTDHFKPVIYPFTRTIIHIKVQNTLKWHRITKLSA